MTPLSMATVPCPCLNESFAGWLTVILLGLALPTALLATGAILSHRRNHCAPRDQDANSPESSTKSLQ